MSDSKEPILSPQLDMNTCTEISDARINDIFGIPSSAPFTCSICFSHKWETGPDWVVACDAMHSFCRNCITQHVRTNNDCPECRLSIRRTPDGEFVRNRDRNEASNAFNKAYPMWNPDSVPSVSCPNHSHFSLKFACTFETSRPEEMRVHLSKHCLGETVSCPYAPYGCKFSGPRGKIQDHLVNVDHTPTCAIGLVELTLRRADEMLAAERERSARAEQMAIQRYRETCDRMEGTFSTVMESMNTLVDAINLHVKRIESFSQSTRQSIDQTKEEVKRLAGVVERVDSETKEVVSRLWKASTRGKGMVPIGPGSRPGTSERCNGKRRAIDDDDDEEADEPARVPQRPRGVM